MTVAVWNIATLVATVQDAWHGRVSAGTGWPSVRILKGAGHLIGDRILPVCAVMWNCFWYFVFSFFSFSWKICIQSMYKEM